MLRASVGVDRCALPHLGFPISGKGGASGRASHGLRYLNIRPAGDPVITGLPEPGAQSPLEGAFTRAPCPKGDVGSDAPATRPAPVSQPWWPQRSITNRGGVLAGSPPPRFSRFDPDGPIKK